MAKKKQSLTKTIEELINSIGKAPAPTLGDIKGLLIDALPLVESLEHGSAVREAESKISILEAALKESQSALKQSQAETDSLLIELHTARDDVDRFRAEQEKREKENREIEPKQLEILSRLPTENQGGLMTFGEIIQAVSISFEEAEIRLDSLQKEGLVIRGETFSGHIAWQRTIEGTKLVLARRLAGEEEEKQPQRKHANRTEIEEDVVKALAMLGAMDCHDFATNTRIRIARR